MKIITSLLLTTFLHAESPFADTILANDNTHGGSGKLELLTDGKMMLIRQPGEGFKRASSLIDLGEHSFTHIQHHNHSYTVVGKMEDWPKIAEMPDRPASKAPEPPKVTVTDDKKEILGRKATRFTAITPAKSGDQENPALDEKNYTLPADHRLMRHPMQEMKRHEAERKKLNNQKTQ
jgi:hypothetical protein